MILPTWYTPLGVGLPLMLSIVIPLSIVFAIFYFFENRKK